MSHKQDALDALSSLPENTEIDDIMYRLYVIDKIRSGQEAIKNGKKYTVEELKKEIETW